MSFKTNLGKHRIGETAENAFGSKMEIVDYKNASDVLIRFIDSGELVSSFYRNFKRGEIRSSFDKTQYGIGYLGKGKYNASVDKKNTPHYSTWISMMSRCYDDKVHKRQPTYKDTTVCEEWHNFQNFADWYENNYYEIEGEIMCLDKDIIVKDNRVYSPSTCIFVPKRINSLFTKSNAKRSSLPIGVYKSYSKYETKCNNGRGEVKYIGVFNTIEEAFQAYKQFKEKVIKHIAEEYKNRIPFILYESMMNYRVDIND